MIEKQKENSKIKCLRITYKFEFDYNLVLKFYWPKIINCIAEKNGTIGKSQMENQKNKSATDAALTDEFFIETARINQQLLAIQQNNASTLYGSIIDNYELINSRREGTPKNVCKLRVNALNSPCHYIQTTLGISEEKNSHEQHPIHSEG